MKIKFALVVEGKIVLRGEKAALRVMRRIAEKRGGYVFSLDSKARV